MEKIYEKTGMRSIQPITDSDEAMGGIQFNLPQDQSVGIIKVVGVGGGGCNAVRNMWMEGITNVTFAVCNTDSQQLVRCPVPVKLQLGEDGLGAGGGCACCYPALLVSHYCGGGEGRQGSNPAFWMA